MFKFLQLKIKFNYLNKNVQNALLFYAHYVIDFFSYRFVMHFFLFAIFM